MRNDTLQGALEALYGAERRRDKFGLDGTRALLAALGNPERRFKSVHVAGTNGKGSTCALIERVLRASGVRTGLFTSPHLVDFRERIRVNGRWADQAWLSDALARITALPEGRDRTFFEVVTALGFLYFAEHDVEWAVIEVGLGGRLDSTNVITPEVSVITSIDLDHTELLGETLAAIAAEKAGIIKPGVPVVTQVVWTSANAVIAKIAATQGAPTIPAETLAQTQAGSDPDVVGYRTRAWGTLRFEPGPLWPMQSLNAVTSLATLDVLAEHGLAIPTSAVLEGCRRARWPGRLDRCPREPRLLWSGAHNAAGAWALRRVWPGHGWSTPAAVVLAMAQDKDVVGVLAALAELSDRARLIVTRSRSERALPPERIAAAALDEVPDAGPWEWAGGWNAEIVPDVVTACQHALDTTAPDGLVLLTGSLFAVGEAMEAFGGAPGEQL